MAQRSYHQKLCVLELQRAACVNWIHKQLHSQEHATTNEVTSTAIEFPAASRDVLTELLRQGGQEMLAAAIEAGVNDWIAERESF